MPWLSELIDCTFLELEVFEEDPSPVVAERSPSMVKVFPDPV
jgi:hypothetical protein